MRLRRSRVPLLALGALLIVWYFFRHHRGPLIKPKHAPSLSYKDVDWRQFAYAQFAPDGQHLCSAVMLFDDLDRFGSKAKKILVYSDEMDLEVLDSRDRDSQLLQLLRDEYQAVLVPVSIRKLKEHKIEETRSRLETALAKSELFRQTQFTRIVYLDSDVTLLKHTDNLFLLPSAPVAMPRAYRALPHMRSLATSFMVIEPSEIEASRVAKTDLDKLYGDSAIILPHRQYGLSSAEFRAADHSAYFGNDYEEWDPDRAMREASLVHFDDDPLPKPWVMWPHQALQDSKPSCEGKDSTGNKGDSCRDRDIWLELYNKFRKRRKDICGLLSVPAPEWPPKNHTT